jgi:hypothetical protein
MITYRGSSQIYWREWVPYKVTRLLSPIFHLFLRCMVTDDDDANWHESPYIYVNHQ